MFLKSPLTAVGRWDGTEVAGRPQTARASGTGRPASRSLRTELPRLRGPAGGPPTMMPWGPTHDDAPAAGDPPTMMCRADVSASSVPTVE